MNKKTLLIFDVDGTLIDGNKLGSRCFADSYQETFGRAFPTINWSSYPHVTDDTILDTVFRQHFNRTYQDDELNRFQAYYFEQLQILFQEKPSNFTEVPGAIAALKRLSDQSNIILGIATGGWKKSAQLKLDHINLPHNDLIFYGADGHETRESIIDSVMQEARVLYGDFSKTVYVGDAIWDVNTTQNMQLPFVGIRIGGDVEKLKCIGAQHVVVDYTNFDAFWDAIKNAIPPIL